MDDRRPLQWTWLTLAVLLLRLLPAPLTASAELPMATLNVKEVQAQADFAQARFQAGEDYFSLRDFSNAAVCYRQAAEKGHAAAQISLAACYATGRGVALDLTEAARWSQRATETLPLTRSSGGEPDPGDDGTAKRVRNMAESAAVPGPDVETSVTPEAWQAFANPLANVSGRLPDPRAPDRLAIWETSAAAAKPASRAQRMEHIEPPELIIESDSTPLPPVSDLSLALDL